MLMYARPRTALLAIAIVMGAACSNAHRTGAEDTASAVHAPAGELHGVVEEGVRVFRSIPYALPPVGDRRWRPPEPMPRWKGIREAQAPGPACMQPPMAEGPYNRGKIRMDEDCLTLNVTAPRGADNAPVMVWIHGGTLIWGSGHSRLYEGHEFAKRGVVLVSINYRLGVFGYLAHPGLSAESPEGVSGNYGLLDQIAALRWVRENIASFGGDPGNVTVFGESAGALSVEYLLASPRAHRWFDKAIVQSGYLFTMPELRHPRFEEQSAESIGVAVSSAIGRPGVVALRQMGARELLEAVGRVGYLPYGTIDGKVLPRQLVDTFERGEQAPVPLMAGHTSGEIRGLRFLLPPPPADERSYVAEVRRRYGNLADRYLQRYPAQDHAESALAAARDAVFGWASERLVRNQAAIGQPAYLYYFDHDYPSAAAADMTAFHASEVPFVFGTFDATPAGWPTIDDTPEQRRISDAMLDYWTSFAAHARPVSMVGPDWEGFVPQSAYLHFAIEPRLRHRFMPGMYALHEEIMCRRREEGSQSWNWRTGSIAPPLPDPIAHCTAAAQ